MALSNRKLTREDVERCGAGGSGLPTGGAPHQQLVTDADGVAKWEERPYYKTTTKRTLNDIAVDFGIGDVTPYEFTTVETDGLNTHSGSFVGEFLFEVTRVDDIVEVIFDEKPYSCVVQTDVYGSKTVGATFSESDGFDFSEYPFYINDNGLIVTVAAGDHVVDNVAVPVTNMIMNYAPKLKINTVKDDNGAVLIATDDLLKLKDAYKNNILISLNTNFGNLGLVMDVSKVTGPFIYSHALDVGSKGLAQVYSRVYNVADGSVYREARMFYGTAYDNGNSYPVMDINNTPYKISIGDSGTLIATKIT